MTQDQSFMYYRTVRFQDTDAAGVVYFANMLSICHEAYEASLAADGIDVRLFFSQGAIAVPIVHAAVDFHRPAFCGDRLAISLQPQQQSESKFDIHYQVCDRSNQLMSQATTQHMCIDGTTRRRQSLPPFLLDWLMHTKTASSSAKDQLEG